MTTISSRHVLNLGLEAPVQHTSARKGFKTGLLFRKRLPARVKVKKPAEGCPRSPWRGGGVAHTHRINTGQPTPWRGGGVPQVALEGCPAKAVCSSVRQGPRRGSGSGCWFGCSSPRGGQNSFPIGLVKGLVKDSWGSTREGPVEGLAKDPRKDSRRDS